MDYFLDIIIPKKEVEVVEMKEKLLEWGGKVYSCEPPQYITCSDIIFEQIYDTKYYSEIIGKDIETDFIILSLKSNVFGKLEYAINNGDMAIEKNELCVFLTELFGLSEFYLIAVREDEKVQERYRIDEKNDIVKILCDSLNWSNPKDVLLYKGNSV